MLKGQGLNECQRSCVEQRAAEKDVLQYLIDLADMIPSLVTLKPKEARKAIQSLPKSLEAVSYTHLRAHET